MTTDTKLLPFTEYLRTLPAHCRGRIDAYARANVSHATAPLQAEIEALKVEVAAQRARADAMAGEAIKHEARAKRQAEALREAQPVAWQFQDRDGKWHGFMDERHRQNTIADGSWPIRALYTAPPIAPVGAAEAWQEGYRQGVLDERASEDNIGIAGFCAKVEPARNNPYALAQQPASSAPVGDSLLQTALRNLPQYISKSGLVGPDMHSAMQCFEVLRDALAQQPASSAPDPAAGDAVAMQPVAEVAMSDDGYKIGLLGPLRAHRLPLGTKLYASPRAAISGANAPVEVEWPLSLLRSGHWREVYVGHRCMRLEVIYDYATWERLMEQVEAALAPQPAVCPKCDGTGEADSGGIYPWGAPATIPCDCPHPTAVDGEEGK